MKTALNTILILTFTTPAFADANPLKVLLAKSELVVAGEIVSQPAPKTTEAGVVTWGFKFKVLAVLKGEKLPNSTIQADLTRFESGERDRLPYLKKGAKCILFLRNSVEHGGTKPKPIWVGADLWFGIQPMNTVMAEVIFAAYRGKSKSKLPSKGTRKRVRSRGSVRP